MNRGVLAHYIIFGMIGFGIIFRIYEVFFGQIARSMKSNFNGPKIKLNGLQDFGKSFDKERVL